MRKKLAVILVSVLFVSILFCYGYGLYMQEMDNMQIVLRISGRGDIAGSDYIREYLLIILPESEFHGERTVNAVKLYLWIANRGGTDRLEMVFYDSQEHYENQKSYYAASSTE